MADTALTVVTNALQEIGAYSPGEPILDADAQTALDVLNQMLDAWSLQSLACFAVLEQSFALTVAKAAYTIGTSGGADVNKTRPIRVIEGPGAAYVQDANKQNYPVEVVTIDKWNLIGLRTSTSNVPSTLFYDPQFPLGTINLFPVPNAGGHTLFFDSFLQLTQLAALATTFSFPPGYKAAIQSNLAVWSGPFFKNALVSEDVKRRARQTFRWLKRANKRTPIGIFDTYIISRASPTYNVYTDSRGV